jgi:hypothetical protein
MHRALFACFWAAAVPLLLSAHLFAQDPPMPGGKGDDSTKPTESAKPKLTLDKLKLPPGAVIVVVDNPKDAMSMRPFMVLLSPEEHKKLLEAKEQLEKLLKADKKLAHACKMTGRLDGDFVFLRAVFVFTTEQPRTTVVLGLQGSHLTDEGELDGQIPYLDFGEEGFLVKVEKEGTHQLVLNLKVPVAFKRSTAPGGPGERGFDLGLPGAAVTTLSLEMPAAVKEVRWNDTVEKQRVQNRWELAMGKIKLLNLAWKEPVTAPGGAPLVVADSQVAVKVDENYVSLSADMTMEDLRGQTREWHLLLPQNAKVDVKTPVAAAYELLVPAGNRRHHIIRFSEPSAERLAVNVQVKIPRPAPRLAVGPFLVLGANTQKGTIVVQAPPEAMRGQRLIFYRLRETGQEDVPKGPARPDVAAVFHYDVQGAVRAAKAPLELEFKSEKAVAEVRVDHFLNVKSGKRGWMIEVKTSLKTKTPPDFLDLQLPRLRIPRAGVLGVSVGVPFPAALPWLAVAPASGKNVPQAIPLDFSCDEDLVKLSPPDAQRKTRLTWNRFFGTEAKVTGKYLVPAGADRVRIDLPRPLDVVERDNNKVTVQVDPQYELVVGTAGSEGPTSDKHRVTVDWDTFPESVDVAWKPYRPEFVVSGITDVWLHDRVAEVQHQLGFTVPAATRLLHSGQVRLRVPAAVQGIKVSGGKLVQHDPAQETALILPDAEALARAEILLRYDFTLPQRDGQAGKGGNRVVQVPLVWPEGSTREEAKVRVWSETGIKPLRADQPFGQESWKDYGIEFVSGSDVLPALVLHGTGVNLPLSLRLVEPINAKLASMVCDRGLIQVSVDEEGTHTYKARYLVRKLNARHLDIEFPVPAVNCLQNVWLDKLKITNWEPLEPVPNVARIPVNPRRYHQAVVLEMEYKLPASFTESKRFWRTTLHAPQFRGDVFLGRVRWQVGLPFSWVALVPSGNMDFRWGIQGWLLGPEPSVTSADLETWLTGRDSAADLPVSLAFSRTGQDNVQLLHLSRQMWLLLCSGLVLALGLSLYVLPLSRAVFWLIVVGLGIGALVVGLLWPGWLPAVVFGCQPGALVLVVLLGIQWMLQESYRRQLVFMPGFARLKANSSLNRNRREPSTVDAPAPAAGSMPSPTQSSSKGS